MHHEVTKASVEKPSRAKWRIVEEKALHDAAIEKVSVVMKLEKYSITVE